MLRDFVVKNAGGFQKHGAILPGDSLKHGVSRLLSVSFGCLCGPCVSLILFVLLATFKNMSTYTKNTRRWKQKQKKGCSPTCKACNK